jgi:hypothetical protein
VFGNRYFCPWYFGDRYFGEGGAQPEPLRSTRTGGISNRKARRPRYWWEKEEKPNEPEIPYRPPEPAPSPVRFDATPDISDELRALDQKLDAEAAAEAKAKRDKRRQRVEMMLVKMMDE